MTTTQVLPPHQRLSEARMRHLVQVLSELHRMTGQPGFDPFRNPQTQNKVALVDYIQRNFTPTQIDEAWAATTARYPKNQPWGGRRGRSGVPGLPDPTGAQTGQFDPAQGYEPEPALGQGHNSSGGQHVNYSGSPVSGAGQGQGQSGQGQGTGTGGKNYPQRPQAPSNPVMQPLVDQLWPLLEPKVYDVAKAGDVALQDAIGQALKQIAARGGTQQGTVTIQTAVTLTTPTLAEPKNLGIQHKNFPKLLKAANARLRSGHRLNVWLYGPPGTGKTTACEQLAKALEIPFHANSALITQYEVIGFRDAAGTINTPEFRKAWEHGGVYLLDEIDASTNAAVLALNAALANGFCVFPDKIVYRHTDCVVVAGANTTGQGGTLDYVGRNKQDSTTLDRFVFLDWPLDEGLEAAMVADEKWLAHVRKIRGNVARRAVKNGLMITPRASVYGEALLAAGLEWQDVEAMTLRKGASDDVWSSVRA